MVKGKCREIFPFLFAGVKGKMILYEKNDKIINQIIIFLLLRHRRFVERQD